MVAAFHKAYVVLVLAIVLLVGLAGAMRVEMTAPQHHGTSIHRVAGGPNIPCPPPPFTCVG